MEDYDDSPFYVEFDKDWFEEDIFQIRILKDLGESEEEFINNEGVLEKELVHRYKVEFV